MTRLRFTSGLYFPILSPDPGRRLRRSLWASPVDASRVDLADGRARSAVWFATQETDLTMVQLGNGAWTEELTVGFLYARRGRLIRIEPQWFDTASSVSIRSRPEHFQVWLRALLLQVGPT